MITIVVGTNRPQSKSRLIAQFYQRLLDQLQAPNQLLDLADLPNDFTESAYTRIQVRTHCSIGCVS